MFGEGVVHLPTPAAGELRPDTIGWYVLELSPFIWIILRFDFVNDSLQCKPRFANPALQTIGLQLV